MKKLKATVLEMAKIAQDCPENLQQTCFEILLKHALGVGSQQPDGSAPETKQKENGGKQEPTSAVEKAAKAQADLSSTDLHVRARRFIEKYRLNLAHLNQLFYKEGDKILPLYEELKTTRTSESQIRITLLQCLRNAIQTGKFQTSVEAARVEARTRKCYDRGNWSGNYTNNAGLFDFEKYSKQIEAITLSEAGKSELAEVVKELQ